MNGATGGLARKTASLIRDGLGHIYKPQSAVDQPTRAI